MLRKPERSVSRGREPTVKKSINDNEDKIKQKRSTSKGSRSSSASSSSSGSSSYSSSSSQSRKKDRSARRGSSRSSSSFSSRSRSRRHSYSSSSYSSRSSFSSRSRSRSPFTRRRNRFRGRSFSRSRSRSRSPFGGGRRQFRGRPRSFSRSRSPPRNRVDRGVGRGRFPTSRRRSPSPQRNRRRSPSPPSVIKSVLVSNLSFNLSKEHVEEILGGFGKIASVKIRVYRNINIVKKNDVGERSEPMNKNDKAGNGDEAMNNVSADVLMDVDESSSTAVVHSVKKQVSCQEALVEYENDKDAENAIKGMNGGIIDGCLVTVTMATMNDLKSENSNLSAGDSASNRKLTIKSYPPGSEVERRRMTSRRSPSPYNRRPGPPGRRSPSPFGRRSGPPPSRRRSPSPYRRGPRRRSPSPYSRRTRQSPLRKRSHSPRSRSRSPPIRRRSRTPPISVSKKEQSVPNRSFVNPERLKNVPL